MFSRLFQTDILAGGMILAAVQLLAALPWIRAIDPRGFAQTFRTAAGLVTAAAVVVGLGLVGAIFLSYKANSSAMPLYGRIYGAVLHLQLLIGLFLGAPSLLNLIAPKVGAVAQAAYRESWRQPLFWLIAGFGLIGTWAAVILPYFTFGDDFKMMKQIGFDIVMLSAALFGVLAASMSISEEIEGRTAITVMSKPINRRQFLLGKFFGILMACAGMSLILGWNLNWALLVMPEFDPINKDRAFDPMPEEAKEFMVPAFQAVFPPFPSSADVNARAEQLEGSLKWLRAFCLVSTSEVYSSPAKVMATGAGMWFGETLANLFGILLGFGQVMILVAIATALATRLPFVINLVLCLIVYFLGHLAPVVVKVADRSPQGQEGLGLVRFLGNLFDTLMPALEFFNMGPAIIRETPLQLWDFAGYAATVSGYAALYSLIAIIVGLLLFEDRDLA